MSRLQNLIPFDQIENPDLSTSKGNAASWLGKPWILIRYIVSYGTYDLFPSELTVREEAETNRCHLPIKRLGGKLEKAKWCDLL